MAEWKRIEFLFILACIYVPALLLVAGIAVSGLAGLVVVWSMLAIALAVILCYIYRELDDVRYVVMDAVGVSIARRLTLGLMLQLSSKAREYRRTRGEIDRLREEKQLCLSLKRIHNINCNSIDREIRKLEEKREQIAQEISNTIYSYFYKRIVRGS